MKMLLALATGAMALCAASQSGAQVVVSESVVVPQTVYYTPAPTTVYYAPTTTYYAPTPAVTYYTPAPTVAYYAPTPAVTYYTPAVPVVVRYRPYYVPGQPVRNTLRAVFW